LRIIVLGDFQYNESEVKMTEEAMKDVSKAKPDLIISLGDYGCNSILGRPEGIKQAYFYLNSIGCDIRPILGNHDLQKETGDNILPHGTMSKVLCELFGIDSPHGVVEFEKFRLFFISVDPQPPESCYYTQECYLSDENFEQILVNLKKRPGVPVIFFTHAPPISSGLLTVPDVHVRATNAFLDQNHNPYRWVRLFQEFPEVVLWFSAHYHLGHMHPGSTSERLGTVFFMNGVHSNVTRDGDRQSRVIDITPELIQIKTFDHNKRDLLDRVDWEYKGNLSELVKQKKHEIKAYLAEDTSGNHRISTYPPSLIDENLPIKVTDDFVTGKGNVIPKGLVYANNRIFAATDNGYLWEIDMQYREALGTLHYNEPPLKGIAVTGNLMWRIWDNKIAVSDLTDPFRFKRERSGDRHKSICITLEKNIHFICKNSDKSVLIGYDNRLFEGLLHKQKIEFKKSYGEYSSINQSVESSVLDLNNGNMLLLTNGQLLLIKPDSNIGQEICIKGFKAAAMCRIPSSGEIDKVCIALNSLEGNKLPRFQAWEINRCIDIPPHSLI
jgi:hypothetical protein